MVLNWGVAKIMLPVVRRAYGGPECKRITRIALMTEACAVQNDSTKASSLGKLWLSLASLHRPLPKVSIDIHLPRVSIIYREAQGSE